MAALRSMHSILLLSLLAGCGGKVDFPDLGGTNEPTENEGVAGGEAGLGENPQPGPEIVPVDAPSPSDAEALARTYCADPLGGEAAHVTVRWEAGSHGVSSLVVEKVDAHGNTNAGFEDILADGIVDSTWSTAWTYDKGGLWSRSELDVDEDGVADSIQETELDEDGRLLVSASDADGNGAWDIYSTYTYDDEGQTLSNLTEFDDQPDSLTLFTYEDNGGRGWTTDRDGDGDIDASWSHVLVDDDTWLDSHDFEADGVPDSVFRSRTDEHGNVIEAADDLDADGHYEQVSTYSYTDAGNPKQVAYDVDADGSIDQTWSYTYDVDDRPLSVEARLAGGTLQSRNVYVYAGDVTTWTTTSYDSDGAVMTGSCTTENDVLIRSTRDDDSDGTLEGWMRLVNCP